MFTPNVTKDTFQIIRNQASEIFIFPNLRHFQRPQVQVIFFAAVFHQCHLPDSFQHGIHIVDPHICDPVNVNLSILAPMTGAFLKAYHDAHYRGDNTVVALTGSFSQEVLEDIRRRFSALPAGRAPAPVPAAYTPAFVATPKPIEQNHLTLAFPGLDYNSPKRFALQLLSAILGGGVSSRLFQQVREQQGLCYSIYSYGAGHAETGVFCIYTALNKETEAKALATIRRVIDDFLAKGPTTEELERAREQSKANVIMGLESTQSRMSHAGRSLLFSGEILTPEQILDAYDRVTREDVVALAQEIFNWEQASLSAVGQVRTAEEYRQLVLG